MTKKTNNSLAIPRRNLSNCPTNIYSQCYQTLVMPILEYASTPCDPHTKTNMQKLEAVQRRAARLASGDYMTTSCISQMIS